MLKAYAWCAGGYTTGRADVVSVLRQRARPYLFSNTLAPAVVGASLEAFDMLAGSSELRNTLQANTRYFRDAMQQVVWQQGLVALDDILQLHGLRMLAPASQF